MNANILVYEDSLVDQLYPITTGRAAFEITCASFRLIDWLRLLPGDLTARIRPHLRTLQLQNAPDLSRSLDTANETTLVINARIVPSHSNYEKLKAFAACPDSKSISAGGRIVAAKVSTASIQDFAATDLTELLETSVDRNGGSPNGDRSDEVSLFEYPHDVIRFNQKSFEENLAFRLRDSKFREIRDDVFAHESAKIDPSVVSKSGSGPILIDENASIGPFSFLEGPAYIGPNARVIEHSAIKDAVSIAHTTKIGGEVEASVIEAYTNKQHHGFMGHSYLGSWINLGAGTCNSDLKNTYGDVKMEYRGAKVSSGMQFVGCIMGDYAKSAINTGIFTGKIIGTCSMVYGFVTTTVPSFVNYARLFGQITELPPSVMAATQQRMFRRRNVQQRPSDIQLLHDMYELTRHERQLAEEPLVF